MPRELALFDALIPTILLALVAAALVSWMLDWLFARYRIYRLIWYPALFRISMFAGLFAAFGLAIY